PPTTNDQRPTTPTDQRPATETRVAIIGHPNVGKSTLLNRLTGTDRSIVSPIPGTTRDAVDEIVRRNDKLFRFIDTAGIRRKGKTHLMAEKLSVVMARKHLEAADIALLVIDATEGVSALDAAIAGYAHESGRSVIILVNKWDLVGSAPAPDADKPRTRAARLQDSKRVGDRAAYEQRLRYALKFLAYAPVLFISAASGKGADKIFPVLEQVAAERRKRITTGEMNRFLKHVDFDRASVPVRQRVKILYLTQAAVAPPTFVLFTDRKVKLHFSYQRFLENQIRHAFGFVGAPIWIKVRARKPAASYCDSASVLLNSPTRSTPEFFAIEIASATYRKSTSSSLFTNATRSARCARILTKRSASWSQARVSSLILSAGRLSSPADASWITIVRA